jgi:hypothetical protein
MGGAVVAAAAVAVAGAVGTATACTGAAAIVAGDTWDGVSVTGISEGGFVAATVGAAKSGGWVVASATRVATGLGTGAAIEGVEWEPREAGEPTAQTKTTTQATSIRAM